jgi:serine/threonine protein kinase
MPQAPQGAAETLEASEPDLAGLPTVDVQGEKPAQADLPDAPTQLTRFGHYVLLHELGRGGMGVVYAAYDEKLDRKVAIKVLRAQGDPSAQRRLVREAQGLARLSHPGRARPRGRPRRRPGPPRLQAQIPATLSDRPAAHRPAAFPLPGAF